MLFCEKRSNPERSKRLRNLKCNLLATLSTRYLLVLPASSSVADAERADPYECPRRTASKYRASTRGPIKKLMFLESTHRRLPGTENQSLGGVLLAGIIERFAGPGGEENQLVLTGF
jgi:hypothetical protein